MKITVAMKIGAVVGALALALVVVVGISLVLNADTADNALEVRTKALSVSERSSMRVSRAREMHERAQPALAWLRGEGAESDLTPLLQQLGWFAQHSEAGSSARESVEALKAQVEAFAALEDAPARAAAADAFAEKMDAFLAAEQAALTDALGEVIAAAEGVTRNAELQSQVGWIALFAVLFVCALMPLLIRRMTRPIKQITHVANRLAVGDLREDVAYTSSDEIGDMAESFRHVMENQRERAKMAENIAAGDLNAVVRVASEHDALGLAMNEMREILVALVGELQGATDAAASGRLDTRLWSDGFEGAFREVVEGVNTTLDAVINPVNEAATVLANLSEYDLRPRVAGEYEGDHAKIKDALNATADALDRALLQVAEVVQHVSSASSQIASTSSQLAGGASQQAAALDETGRMLGNFSELVQANAASTQEASEKAQRADLAAEEGNRAMAQMKEAMAEIRASAHNTMGIISTIDEIAEQTNLLALNAAIEAAGAGAAGRSFAVVAHEIRGLAVRCKGAAQRTDELVRHSVELVSSGEAFLEGFSEKLAAVAAAVRELAGLASNIATVSQDQASGIQQVNAAVEDIEQVVQQNAAISEETSSSARELSNQADRMAELIRRFKLSGVSYEEPLALVEDEADVDVEAA